MSNAIWRKNERWKSFYFLMISSIVNPCDLAETLIDSALSCNKYSERLPLDCQDKPDDPLWLEVTGDENEKLFVDDAKEVSGESTFEDGTVGNFPNFKFGVEK